MKNELPYIIIVFLVLCIGWNSLKYEKLEDSYTTCLLEGN